MLSSMLMKCMSAFLFLNVSLKQKEKYVQDNFSFQLNLAFLAGEQDFTSI